MTPILPSTNHPKTRRPYRVPLGMPKARDDWRMGSVVSAFVHLAIVVLLLTPLGMLADISEIEQGAGGPGPAGGGGGGNRGTGRLRAEVLKFVRVAPPMPTPKPAAIVPPPTPLVIPPTPLPQVAVLKEAEPTMTVGVGGGSGTDLTSGSGPGSGGGVGTGIGPGRGSATGAGTGGGAQVNYPPTAIEMFIPPLPTPASVKGFRLVAEFDVDEKGKVVGMNFTPTKDRGYNRRLEEVLRGYRFRPGTRPDGTPIRMKAQIFIELP